MGKLSTIYHNLIFLLRMGLLDEKEEPGTMAGLL